MAIHTIIFDCFGVLVTDTLVAFCNKYLRGQPDSLREFGDMTRAVDLGYLTKPEFHKKISQLTGLDSGEIYDILEGGSVLDDEMMDLVGRLAPNYKIGMLSNISPSRLDDFFLPKDKELFDSMVLSFEIGAVKPDERAYLAALQRLGSMAEESLFIDDQARNVEAAREVGMEAILFKDYQSLCRELGNYGILTS